MSIETLLTLGVAAAILAVAAVLRLIFLGVLHLVYMLTGRHITWVSPVHPVSARPRRHELARDGLLQRLSSWTPSRADAGAFFGRLGPSSGRARDVLTAVATALIYALAIVGSWLRAIGEAGVRAGGALYARARPSSSSGAATCGRGIASATEKLRSFAVVAVATMQHFAGATATRLRNRKHERASRSGDPASGGDGRDRQPQRSTADRVVVLDEAWDPLTDPLEDEPAPSVR